MVSDDKKQEKKPRTTSSQVIVDFISLRSQSRAQRNLDVHTAVHMTDISMLASDRSLLFAQGFFLSAAQTAAVFKARPHSLFFYLKIIVSNCFYDCSADGALQTRYTHLSERREERAPTGGSSLSLGFLLVSFRRILWLVWLKHGVITAVSCQTGPPRLQQVRRRLAFFFLFLVYS